ncbi:unnamed protein product, partial [Closterium sp. NIES-54]
HMVGSERYISNAIPTPADTYVTVANKTRLRASAQGIVVLKARGSRTHITSNDVLIVQNLRFNVLSVAQLMDCGVDLSIDPDTRDILLHYTTTNKSRKRIGRAHSGNGVYILTFDIPNCSGDSQELIDLVPTRFEHIHHRDWKHPDGRPWVPHHLHPRELALHDPDPDGICRDCHTPTASMSAIADRGLAAIAEAEREAPPEEGLSHIELKTATRVVFGTEEHPLPGPASQHLWGMLHGVGVATFDAHGVPRPYTKEKFMEIYSHQCDSMKKLTVVQEEGMARREAEELRQRSRAAHLPGANGEKRRVPPMKGGGEVLADGARATLAAIPADGAPHLAARQADGALPAKAGELPARTKGGKQRKSRQNLLLFLLVALRAALHLEFLALMLTTTNGNEEAEEVAADPTEAPAEDPAEALARYMRTSGFCADDAIWHQRLGHPSRVTLKNCIEEGVFVPGALLRPNGTKVRGATHPCNCTVCPEAALSHQPTPLLELGTNRYAKLEKVYSDILNVGHCGINDELYTVTFVDAAWIVNVEARSRAYEVFRLLLAHAQWQSGEKLKIWQSDGAAEFRSKEMQDYLAQKGIEHHISLPYAHQ